MSLDIGTLTGYLELDDAAFADGLSGALDKMGSFAGKAAKIAGAAGLGAATAFAGSAVSGMNIEAANDKLAAQLGLTAPESERIGKVAGELYAGAYGESMDEVNVAVGAVMSSIKGMTTASSADLEAASVAALDFATTFDVDVQRAVATAGTLLNSGLAKDATQAFDLITAASQKVPAHLREDLLDASDEYSQFFNTLGYTGEEAFSLLVTASEKGMYGIDKMGDAVKEFTIRATDMSKATGDAYEAIGLDMESMTTKLLAGGPTAKAATDQIVAGLLGIKDPGEQAAAAIALFGTPLEDLNTGEIPQFLQQLAGGQTAMAGFGGAAERMGATLNDNANANLTSFKRQAQQAFTTLANDAIPHINAAAKALATEFGPALEDVKGVIADDVIPVLQDIAGWIGENETALTIIAGVILATYIPALVAAGVATLISGAQQLAGWLMARAGALGTLALYAIVAIAIVGYWVVMGVVAMASALSMAAAWFIALGPVGWVIAIVVGLVALVIANWDKVKQFTTKAWSSISGAVAAAWQWIREKTVSIGGAMLDWVRGVPGKVVSFFSGWSLVSTVSGHFARMKDGAVQKAASLLSWAAGLPGQIVGKLSGLAGDMVDVGVNAAQGIWDGLQSMSGWLADKVWAWVKSVLPGPVEKALGIASPSKVMRDLARWVPEGMALGIDDGVATVEAASQRMAAAAIPAMPSAGAGGQGSPAGRPGRWSGGPYIEHLHVKSVGGEFSTRQVVEEAAWQAGG